MTIDLLELLVGTVPTGYEYLAYIFSFVLAMLMLSAILKLFDFFGNFR